MPARTNDFQDLINLIYVKAAPSGCTVTESALLVDSDGDTREVDILIQFDLVGHTFQCAVECRDRSRKATVNWIEEIVGKRNSLPQIDKWIAVSRSGFGSQAIKKARSNGIETLSFEEATERDWTAIAILPGVELISEESFSLQSAEIFFDSSHEIDEDIGDFTKVWVNGAPLGTLGDLVADKIQNVIAPRVEQWKSDGGLNNFKTRDDLRKGLLVSLDSPMSGAEIELSGGKRVPVAVLRVIVMGTRSTWSMPMAHHIFNGKMVSTGQRVDGDGSLITFDLVQEPNSNTISGRWKRAVNGAPTETALLK